MSYSLSIYSCTSYCGMYTKQACSSSVCVLRLTTAPHVTEERQSINCPENVRKLGYSFTSDCYTFHPTRTQSLTAHGVITE